MTADKKTCSAAYGARPGLSRGKMAGRNVYKSARLTCISPADLYIQVFGTNVGKSVGLMCVGGKGMQEDEAARMRDARIRAIEYWPLQDDHYYFFGQDITLKSLSKQTPNSFPD